MTTKPEIVTCIQERLDNATMIVRFKGKILGRVHQDSKDRWIVRPPEPPEPAVYPSLSAAVDALVDAEMESGRPAVSQPLGL